MPNKASLMLIIAESIKRGELSIGRKEEMVLAIVNQGRNLGMTDAEIQEIVSELPGHEYKVTAIAIEVT